VAFVFQRVGMFTQPRDTLVDCGTRVVGELINCALNHHFNKRSFHLVVGLYTDILFPEEKDA
jgi:hypothetical protein